MAANVVPLKRPVDQEVVELLEEALAQAKAGDLTGVLLLKQTPDGVAYDVAGVKDRFTVLGWLSHAMHRLQDDDAG